MGINSGGRHGRLKGHVRHLLAVAAALACGNAMAATLDDVSVGAGMRSSFTSTNVKGGSDEDTSDFELNSMRLYVSGKVTDQLGLMFNTEYNSSDETMKVIDAAAKFSVSDQFNLWGGRFLPPSDRANLYGPYYASNWNVYADGVQDGYPSESTGRADGVMYWGQFGIMKLSLGAFDIPATKGTNKVMTAGRLQWDFWDPEAGYYLNGTYYGDKDLLAIGIAGQNADGDSAYSADFLMEKKLPNAGVVTVESEYAKYDGLGGYTGDESDGWYALGAYLFPQQVGVGKFQILGKFGSAKYEFDSSQDYQQDTTEIDLNYVIQTFNARLSLFYADTDYNHVGTDFSQVGLGLQIQI